MTITVTAKINAGHHPRYGAIVAGQEYVINAADYSAALFHPLKTAPVIKTGKKKAR